MKGRQWINFRACAIAQPLGDTPRHAKAWGDETPRAIWAVSEIENVRARNRFDGIPYTRLAAGQSGRKDHMAYRGVGFKAPHRLAGALLVGRFLGQSKRLQSLRLFANHSVVGVILRHSLRAFFGTLFLPETCFGTGPGLIRFGCQCRLPFGEPSNAFAV
jgi:hypothetical protein